MSVSSAERACVPVVVWHDVECGAYRSDLPLWRSLAARAASRAGTRRGPTVAPGARVLDIGAGTGRVALDLARAGHDVLAFDLDPDLLATLRIRAGDLPVRCMAGDARRLALAEGDFDLCLVPMQTVQLLGGAEGRASFLSAVARHLCSGGILACAISERLDAFDAGEDGAAPAADWRRVHGALWISRPTAVRVQPHHAVLERRREVQLPDGSTRREDNVIVLDRLSGSELSRECRTAGLRPLRRRRIAPTSDHVGSTVVLARA